MEKVVRPRLCLRRNTALALLGAAQTGAVVGLGGYIVQVAVDISPGVRDGGPLYLQGTSPPYLNRRG
jgi:hypothetical protein